MMKLLAVVSPSNGKGTIDPQYSEAYLHQALHQIINFFKFNSNSNGFIST